MNDKEQVIFEKFIDDHGAFLTSLSLEDNPEVIIAIMGENLNNDHPSPAGFGKQMSVPLSRGIDQLATMIFNGTKNHQL